MSAESTSTITLGHVTPYTGSLAGFASGDKFVLDGTSASALANAFQAQTGNQWVQGIGSTYALFEIAKEVFSGVSDPHNRHEVAHAGGATGVTCAK